MEKVEFKVAFQTAPNAPEEYVCTEKQLSEVINMALAKSPVCIISKIRVYE